MQYALRCKEIFLFFCNILLKCMYPARKLPAMYIYTWVVSYLTLFLRLGIGTFPTMWYFLLVLIFDWVLELFRRCDILFVLIFDWVLELFLRCDIFCLFSFSIGYWNCSDDVIFFVSSHFNDFFLNLIYWYVINHLFYKKVSWWCFWI
jgi:hypothetical protein